MNCRHVFMTFGAATLAAVIAAPAAAQPAGTPPPAPPVVSPPPPGAGPMGPGPIGVGPMGRGPIGIGPMGPGPTGVGPIGPGPIGSGPMRPGPGGVAPMFMTPWGDFAWAPQDTGENRDREREQRERERENRVYDEAHRFMDRREWDRAIERFNDVIAMKGARTDAALHWKAWSQHRNGQRAEALATITALVKEHPNSRYLKDAKALEVEVRSGTGQPVRPESQSDDELKLMAIQALSNADPAQTVPMLEKLLASPASPRLKERALFVLAQSDSPRAREVLMGLARGNSTPELQAQAINYLGVHGGQLSRAALAEVYSSTSDVDVKRRIIRSFMVSGERDRIVAIAQTDQNAELRREAVRQLGAMGAHDALWTLYQKESSLDVKKQILHAMFVSGQAPRMIELAKSEQNVELRRIAVHNLGLMGGKATGTALVGIYGTDRDPTVRRAAIQALFMQDDAASLVALARKEQDVDRKKEIVQRLSLMAKDPIARDYMLELLNK